MEEKEMMTVKQIAEYMQIDEYTIYSSRKMMQIISHDKLVNTGLIPFIKIAVQRQFRRDVINKWISEKSLERILKDVDLSIKM